MIENKKPEYEPLKITSLVYSEYVRGVKGNLHCTREEVSKKLTRNVLLGVPHPIPNTNEIWYHYGAMRILVIDAEYVVAILNHMPIDMYWREDLFLKHILNKKLQIA